MDLDSFLKSMRSFASSMTKSFDLDDMCYELCQHMTKALSAAGAGVTVADAKDQLRYVTATSADAVELEKNQEQFQAGPCRTAYDDGRPVLVDDVSLHSGWPEYLKEAERVGVGAVLAVPLRTDGKKLGAIDIYRNEPRHWGEDAVMVAETFADMATSYLLRNTELEEANRLGGQLQTALDSRVIIEQAKGMIASSQKVHVDDAFEVLRSHARSSQKKLNDVARSVVEDGYVISPTEVKA